MPEKTWQLPIPFPPGSDGHPLPKQTPAIGEKRGLHNSMVSAGIVQPLAAVFIYVILCEQPPSPQPRVAPSGETPLLPITPPPNRTAFTFGVSPLFPSISRWGTEFPFPPEVHCCPLFNILPGPSSLTGPRPCPKQQSRPTRDGIHYFRVSPLFLLFPGRGRACPFPFPENAEKPPQTGTAFFAFIWLSPG